MVILSISILALSLSLSLSLSIYIYTYIYLFISTEDPVNSKRIVITAGMVGDYSGLSTLYIYIYIYNFA